MQHRVGGVLPVTAAAVGTGERCHVVNSVKILEKYSLVETPPSASTRPSIDIASLYSDLLPLQAEHGMNRSHDVGFATCPVAVQLDDDIRDAMAMRQCHPVLTIYMID